jgi:glycogen debranching enzyme
VLKHGETFGLFDPIGDVCDPQLTPGGIFHQDTRHLSTLELAINGQRPLLLSSTIEDNNVVLTVDVSNPDIYREGAIVVPRETLHVRRSKFLWSATCYERIAIHNFDTRTQRCFVTIRVDADFCDLFEVRGIKRLKRGTRTVTYPGPGTVRFSYVGLDAKERFSEIHLEPAPLDLKDGLALYDMTLEPNMRASIVMTVRCTGAPAITNYSTSYRDACRMARSAAVRPASVSSSRSLANKLFRRGASDLNMLVTQTEYGPYPFAGTPWFNTPFGRDGIITALQVLWLDPGIAKGVLRYLAATQATKTDPRADAEPGKILHETRSSEMALLGEIPFRNYYGSVDATPLFVVLAGAYFKRTNDIATLRSLWPNIRAALGWIDKYGDRDGDGFVEYYKMSEHGLANQGWKDSYDSISHADGSLAQGAIALSEVQGYVFAAKRDAALIARALGEPDTARKFERQAEAMRERFESKYWCEELGLYALALDGDKQPCRVKSSNAGQVIFSGIASKERAQRVAHTLLTPECFSGWGIRTLAAGSARFNPMSYHNGSVWPHDNALIALGFGWQGLKRPAIAIFNAMYDAARHMDLMRFPELFCGFPRRSGIPPTLYPVACLPQAWASVVPFALLEASLGICCDAARNEIVLRDPVLPRFLDDVRIANLSVGDGSIDLFVRREGTGDVAISTTTRRGDIAVKIVR